MEGLFKIISEVQKSYPRFKSEGKRVVIQLTDTTTPQLFIENLDRIFDYLLIEAEPHDMVGISINNESNVNDKAIGISFRRKDQLSSEVIWKVLEKVAQSNARFEAFDKLVFHVDIVHMPSGNGGVKEKGRSVENLSYLKKSIVTVKSRRNCLAHALIIAIARLENDINYTSYRKGYKIEAKVNELLAKTGIDLSNGGGLKELQQFSNNLPDYRIVVFNGLNEKSLMFENGRLGKKTIYLLYDDDNNHYNVIINIAGCFAKKYICKGCNKGCERGEFHVCDTSCSDCMNVPPCEFTDVRRSCDECNRCFRSDTCFQNHKQNTILGKSVCEKKRNCNICKTLIGVNHECFKSYCRTCQKNCEVGHKCYMAVLSSKLPSSSKVLYVFYDLETTQDTPYSDNAFLHVPNLVCAQQFCSACISVDDVNTPCNACGVRKWAFWQKPIEEFVNYLRKPRKNIEKIIAIAHNAKSFDSQFILNYMIKLKWTPNILLNGTKIICMRVHHIVFLDSLNFFPMPLRDLPKAFGLPAQKGYYPHFFNTMTNLNYVGIYPDVSYYGVNSMSERERTDFLAWYQENKDNEFNNKDMLETYCQADVTVLRLACKTFCTLFKDIGNIEVFLESVSIASACNTVFRRNFLQSDTIGIIPRGGYTDGRIQSKQAMMWLAYLQMTEGITIRHGHNGKEYRLPELPNYSVDGYCEKEKTVYEFLGCFWHGHTCLSFRDRPLGTECETLVDRYEKTMTRLEKITGAGYQVKVIWECQFQDILKQNPALKTHPLVTVAPLKTRDALYGGRTEAMKLHYKIKQGKETIQYTDIMSLYPYICKYYKFPVGHPTILNADECTDIKSTLSKEGIIKCQVLPPQNLYHPVLPYRSSTGRLLFSLCKACADEKCETCTHKAEERVLIGTWIVDEVRKAVDVGYKVLTIYEFYEYKVTQYDPQNGVGGLFVDYINTFLKLKVEASGYPDHVSSEHDKDKYIAEFVKTDGILLDKKNIEKNSAKRGLAKLCLNSFWGKLTECNNRPQSQIITDPNELYRLLSTPNIEVTNLLFASDEVVWVSWRFRQEELVDSLPHTNEVLGAYVTTGARLKLYSYLEKLGNKALYCDTDSVVYVASTNEPSPIECGDKLGDMTNELAPNEYIEEFVSGGPKNYAYKILRPDGSTKTVCKVKGITLNYTSSKIVNFDLIKEMVLEGKKQDVIVHTEKKIKTKRKMDGPFVVSQPEDKRYNITFLKRKRLQNNDSLPFGFVGNE